MAYRCPEPTCPDLEEYAKFAKCPKCKTNLIDETKKDLKKVIEAKKKLANVPVVVLAPFDQAVAAVKTAMEKKALKYQGSYQERVILALAKASQYFKDDFMGEMKKGTEVSRFITPAERSTSYMKVCLDSALTATGAAKDKAHPVGEKFDFELPHIMATAGWTFLSAGKEYTQLLPDFCKQAAAAKGHVFMLSTRPNLKSPIGHMLTVTVTDDGTAYVTDAQELNEFFVPTAGYMAWKGPKKDGRALPAPRRKVDLTKAAWAEKSVWEKK